jgi:F-type H+-transporting ATPase subunit delta
MTAATVSDVYAAAVLEAAGDQRTGVVTDAYGIAAALRDAPEAVDMLDHPALNRDQAKEMVEAVFGAKVGELMLNLLKLLVDRGRLRDLPDIVQAIGEQDAAQAGNMHATVVAAEALNETDRQSIQATLQQQTNGTVDIDWQVDPAIRGGLQIRVGELLIDGSAERRLQAVARMIHEAPARGSWLD